MKQKILRFGWLIIAVMVLAFAPKTVQAQPTVTPEKPSSGDGSESNPYQIASKENLYWFANEVNNNSQTSICAVLTRDITVNNDVLDADGNLNSKNTDFYDWTPIGTSYPGYTGTFDGQGHTISGLYINDNNIGPLGLFGYFGESGIIRNVGVKASYFNAIVGSPVGGVCGWNEGTISNCCNERTTVNKPENKAGIVGGVCGNNAGGTIENCYNAGNVSTGNISSRIGGVCGSNDNNATIKNCYFLEETANSGIGYDENSSNSSTQAMSEIDDFKSGKVAWLLNGSEDGTQDNTSPWLQNLSTDGGDKYPVLRANTFNGVCPIVVKDGDDNYKNGSHSYDNVTFADFPDEGTANLYSHVCDHCKGAAKEDEKKIKGLNGKDGEIVVTKVDNKWKSDQEIVLEDNKENPQNSGYNSPIPFTVKSAAYSREMSTSWATLCLPYSISATNSNCTFYTLKSIEIDKIVLEEKTGTINAGTPVFVKRNKDDVSIIVFTENDDVEMMQTSEDQTVTNGNMVGTFKMIELNNENDLFIKDSKMWSVGQVAQANKTMKVLPYRAYISNSPSGAPQRSIAVDGEATAISDALDTLNDANAEYYDMSGRRINSLQKGVNIIRSGNKTRKVIIK